MRRSIRVHAGQKKPNRRSIRRLRRTLACSVACLGLAGAAHADDDAPIRSDYGSPGVIEMPSARMAPDGALSVGGSYQKNIQRYSFSFQALPWLEADFRYSGLQHFATDFPVYYDRSFAFKARLWDEAGIVPAVAVGVNDIIGTGIYSSEYLVASKSLGEDFDATLGVGWGRLGSTALFSNPLGTISKSFDKPRPLTTTPGGTDFGVFFHGPDSGLFGGVTWRTPIDGLSLAVEYSSDKYTVETSGIGACCTFKPRNQINYGVSYQATPDVQLGLDWLYGTSLGAHATFQLDPTRYSYNQRIGDPPLAPEHVRTPEEQQQALNQLLQLRNPGFAAATRLAADHRNALVDALWSESPAPGDVAISGRTLMLRVNSGSPETLCANFGQMVSRYGADIDSVHIETPLGKQARCAVPRPGSFVNTVLHEDQGTWTLAALTTAPLLTIDASLPPARLQAAAIATIRADAAKQRVTILALSLSNGEALVYYENTRYFHETEAVDRLVRVLMTDAPPEIEKFRLLPTLGGMPQTEFDILRAPTERSIAQTDSYHILGDGNALTAAPMQNPVLTMGERGSYPKFSWYVFPQLRQEFFDPDNPLAVQLLAGVQGTVELMPQLSVTAELEGSIYDNFNVGRDADSALPHVRTDFLKFFTKGKNGIGQMEADYQFRLAPDVYALARVGYLESMYAGVGGEVLWRPENQRWAVGADVYDVAERNFDRLFGVQKYHVVTGHVSLYYDTPWDDYIVGLHAGQYLAGDRGVTVDITRRFSTGVEIGAFFTRTNVSAAEFGEGSFDKGFILKIPLGWTLPVSTQNELSMVIRPVQRDGGQRLDTDSLLYDYTRRSSLAEVLRDPDTSP